MNQITIFFYTVGYSWDKGRQKLNREELYGTIEIRFSNPERAERTPMYELSGKHDTTGDYTRATISRVTAYKRLKNLCDMGYTAKGCQAEQADTYYILEKGIRVADIKDITELESWYVGVMFTQCQDT